MAFARLPELFAGSKALCPPDPSLCARRDPNLCARRLLNRRRAPEAKI